MSYLALAKRIEATLKTKDAHTEATHFFDEGTIVAVLIDSPIVGPVWFALNDGFRSGDKIPVFYGSELPHVQKMNGKELRSRYEEKLALGGGWIRDRIEEPTRH